MTLFNKILKHLISLAVAAVVLLTAMLFIYAFTGFLGEASTPIRVGVLDTGLDLTDPRFKGVLCASGHKDFTGSGLRDTVGHGTHIAGLIKEYAGSGGYCLVIVKYFTRTALASTNMASYLKGLEYLKNLRLEIVNISGGGGNLLSQEKVVIESLRDYTTFIVAAGNEGADLAFEPYYPASFMLPNMQVVGALTLEGNRLSTSNYGYPVRYWELGDSVLSTLPGGYYGKLSGTSIATAIRTGKEVSRRLKR